jgi:hypothetical protein
MAKEDPEIKAMKRVERALQGLDAAEKGRVLRFVQERLYGGIGTAAVQFGGGAAQVRGPAPSITFSSPEE